MEVQAQVEILEAEVALLRRTENSTNIVEHAQRLMDAEGRLREALAYAQELDMELNRFQQHIRDKASIASIDAHNAWGPFAHQAGIRSFLPTQDSWPCRDFNKARCVPPRATLFIAAGRPVALAGGIVSSCASAARSAMAAL
jgi:hypothetical protein